MDTIGRRALIAGAGAASLAGAKAPLAKVGEPAPPFTILDFKFKKFPSSAMAGQVIMLNWWATWCGPCRTELPLLDAYYRRHAGQGLQIFAVKSASDDHTNQQLQPLVKLVSFPMAWAITGKGYGEIGGALPTNYVIDRTGVLRYAEAGAFDEGGLEQVVTPLLKEAAPSAQTA